MSAAARIQINSLTEDRFARTLADDALDGLTRPFKEIPPRYLYDARGSELFEEITSLPEYYPTRTEGAILQQFAFDIATITQASELVELGSGWATKSRYLLSAMQKTERLDRFVPFDIAEKAVRKSSEAIAQEYPSMSISGIVGDFEQHLAGIPEPHEGGSRLIAFLGGTIGNFSPGARRHFIRSLSARLGRSGYLLIGTDLIKDIDRVEAAYNDSSGITAEFNRNVLNVLNRELNANFARNLFEHVAFYDTNYDWIDMRLRARRSCRVRLQEIDLEVFFDRGEEIRTEISTKFSRQRLEKDYAACGLKLVGWFTDPEEMFALSLARPQ